MERRLQGTQEGYQEGQWSPQVPGVSNRGYGPRGRTRYTLRAERSRGLQLVLGRALGAAQMAAPRRGDCMALGAAQVVAQALEPRAMGGHSPGPCASHRTSRGWKDTGQRGGSCRLAPLSCADQRPPHPVPGISRPVQNGTVVLTGGADSRAGELAAASLVVPPCVTVCLGLSGTTREEGLHRINSSH